MPPTQRYHRNELSLPPLDVGTLQALQTAIHKSLDVDLTRKAAANNMGIYNGLAGAYTHPGIVLMYLRLNVQSTALLSPPPPIPLMRLQGPPPHQLEEKKVSPLDSGHGPHTIRILHCLITKQVPPDDLFLPLQAASTVASMASPNAAHEVLYGTAGLLAALISARRLGASHPVVSLSNVLTLAERLIERGRTGAAEYSSTYGPGLPLMWPWHGRYYLGAIHGVAGILTILLQLPPEIRDPMMMDIILPATYALLSQVDAHGHLPVSLPHHHRASGELVQLCHGTPGALLLIAALRSARAGQILAPQLDDIESRLSDCVWTEGLLTKGIPLCHGVVGNAWPWLLLAQIHEEPERRDQYLSRALAFLLHATNLPPSGDVKGYATPDDPYSLFTGLAGALCAWSEACTILHNKFEKTHEAGSRVDVLGMPWLGGLGSCGI